MVLHRTPRGRAPSVAVVGAGVCGIALGVKLRQAGLLDFTIFEAEPGVGGTWRVNTYPGAAVDVPNSVYEFSFHPYAWVRSHGTQPELLEYLEATVDKFGLRPHLRLDTPIDEVRWLEDRQCYQVTAEGEPLFFDIVVGATGFLSNPNLPTWPGLEKFTGPRFHTGQWDHSVELVGKRVGIVGVGSSSAQVVPSIQPDVKHVTIFQREPGWVLRRNGREFTPEEVRDRGRPLNRRWRRFTQACRTDWHLAFGPVYVAGSRRNIKAEATARAYIDSVFKDRPDLRGAVTPTYRFSGKRRVQSDDFYETLLKDNVELVPRPVVEVTEHGLVDADGVEHEIDVLVIATGFTAWNYLARLKVFGRGGVEIQETWRDGAYALAGLRVPGFPNFYVMYGPNTNGSGEFGIMWLAEQEANWVIRDIRLMMRRGYTATDTRPQLVSAYNTWLQRRLKRTAWAQANNYMKGPKGQIVTQFHGPATLKYLLMRSMRRLGTYGTRIDS